MFERFDEKARQALFLARVHTSLRRGPTIDMDDLLQGILAVDLDDVSRFAPGQDALSALIAPALRRTHDEELPEFVERIFLNSVLEGDTSREAPFDATTKSALESALAETDALDQWAIRPAHLLLGILRHEGTPAWQALSNVGVTLHAVREAMARDGDGSSLPETP